MDRILIVGAGPAGATAARVLAEAGVPVVICEKSPHRGKSCAGGIVVPNSKADSVPLFPVERVATQARLYGPDGKEATIPLSGGEIRLVDRNRFDPWLVEQATSAGADLINGTVVGLDLARRVVSFKEKGNKCSERFDIIIGADGAGSSVRRWAGLPSLPYHRTVQVRVYPETGFGDDPWDRIEIFLDRRVSDLFYGWAFPKKDHLVIGTGAVSSPAQLKNKLSFLLEQLGPRLGRVKIAPLEGHILAFGKGKPPSSDRFALVGDAAGLVFPASGEGIFYAMKSGEMAALTLLRNGSLKRFGPRYWETYGWRYRVGRLTARMFLSSGPGRRRLVNRAASPGWAERISKFWIEALHGDETTGRAPSRTLVRLLFGR